jgi:hypothetical protein
MDLQTKSLIEKEITEALMSYRTSYTLLTQFITVLLIANVSILGFAFDSHNSALFFLGSICPIIILFIRLKVGQRMLPIIYTAFHLEQKLCKENIDLLSTTYIETAFSSSYKPLQRINYLETHEERMKELKKIINSYHYVLFNRTFLFGTIAYICMSIFQIILSVFIY